MGEASAGSETALKGGSGVLDGLASYSQAMGEKQRAEANAYIGKTRAINTTASSAESLNSELATLRATFAANGQRPSVGNNTIFDELLRVRGREGRIAYGNDMAQVYDANRQASSAQSAANGALLKTAFSIFSMF